jgi:hypothetical protein
MALEGNLRDFSATEILQLLGTQRKTGCLILERDNENTHFYVLDGRLVSSRQPGLIKDDPLLRFLVKIHRLSNEQYRGILTIQRESNRDLEDLLVNGRYLDAEELGQLIERAMLEDLMQVMTWDQGSYKFDPHNRWPNNPLARLSVEAALIETARRGDEMTRFAALSRDPHQLIGVRDLPDTEEQLPEEECELFGIIDGRHTLAEIVEAAPLTEYEAYEALQRMLEAGWIEIVGRRDPGVAAIVLPAETVTSIDVGAETPGRWPFEIATFCGVVLLALVLAITSQAVRHNQTASAARDAFANAGLRDLSFALELYRRDHGSYPDRLESLVADHWIAPGQIRVVGRPAHYARSGDGLAYQLDVAPGH